MEPERSCVSETIDCISKMKLFLLFTFAIVSSAQIIIYGWNIPPRSPQQDFIIFGNTPQEASFIANPTSKPLVPPSLPPQSVLSQLQPIIPKPQPSIQFQPVIPKAQPTNPPHPFTTKHQPFLGGNLPTMFAPVINLQNTPQQTPGNQITAPGSNKADRVFGSSEYHYSWLHDGDRVYDHAGALRYCRALGGGWRAVTLETLDETFFVQVIINSHKKNYLWTGGVRDGAGWKWLNGGAFTYNNWSFTGGYVLFWSFWYNKALCL
ncbi:hypothetical protein SK128_011492 [Halocaridina rubra]|uniref:C-type lectin domain-containing protein n=1 Tax=Halocaridina rubra TaxID=373956 RepID=A0AAN8XS34_HALRR